MNISGSSVSADKRTDATTDVLSFNINEYIISKEERELIEDVCFGGLIFLICTIAIPANVVNFFVFWRQGLQERMTLCLFCLAIVDTCYLCCTFIIFCASRFMHLLSETLSEEFYTKSFWILGGTLYAFRTMSHFISTVIAVERCVCVVYPLRAANLLQARTMGTVLLVALFLFHGCCLLLPFSYHVQKISVDRQDRWLMVPAQFFEDNTDFVYTLIYRVLGSAIPIAALFIVFIATAITVIKLKAATAWRETASVPKGDSHSQQMALTSMLVIVSCVYILTVAPYAAWQSSFQFEGTCLYDERCYEFFIALSTVAFTISLVNSCAHFFIYYSRSSRFRRVFRGLCLCCRKRKVTRTSVAQTTQVTTLFM